MLRQQLLEHSPVARTGDTFGWKIAIALEEMGLDYRLVPVDSGRRQ